MTDAAETIRREIAALAELLDAARATAEAGAVIDLAGLDAQIERLCSVAQALPPPEAKSLLEALDSIIVAIDALGAALARQRDTLLAAAEGRADPHTARQRAAAAYGRGAISTPTEVVIETPAEPEETP